VHGEVVVEGWQTKTGRNILEKMVELRDFVSGFLVTFVEHEGRMQGSALERTGELLNAAGGARITVAGGITSAEEIAALAAQGIDAQVGMALYTNRLTLARAITAPLKSERSDGLWPTVVCDEHGIALGLAWSSQESVNEAVALRRGVYHSRKRGIWRKGETSGAAQELLRIDLDCDSDALRFTVRQHGSGFCHLGTRTCWGALRGIDDVFRHVQSRVKDAPPESYTKRLLDDSELLEAKLLEEAGEVVAAENSEEAVCEAADLLYFTLVKLIKNGASWSDVEAELGRRMLKVTRRPGLAKSRHS
ncbi:MAG TPA: phosphoribosyl-ATP diphosphatase, partial [Oligoflexia bacterium]|nr:phosphoribosyl-ATP diphosphatase [Oligoflexia bacterium]